jgi:molecular chaperone GrpE
MDETIKDELTLQFRACLEQLPEELMETISTEGATDLYALFAELTALKNEVKIESRQVKSALEEFKTVFVTLQEAQEQMAAELTQSRKDRSQLSRALLRPLLRELLDLHDRLAAGVFAAGSHRPSFFARLRKRDRRMLKGLRDGQQMTLRRLEALLASHQVRAMEVLGQSFDPSRMHAAETESRPELADGLVTDELRKGFFWDEELLRIPEVKINKIMKDIK